MSESSPTPRGPMGLQLSVYPVRRADIGAPIRAAIKAAAGTGADVKVGTLSTLVRGDEEELFRAARAAFAAAAAFGDTVMVATFTTGTPTDETVAEIQAGV